MQKNVIDILLDPKDDRNVKLYVDGKLVDFEQIANIEYEGELYAFLFPLEPLEGCAEDEGVLFQFVKIDDKIEIEMVDDVNIIDRVYQEYLNMIGDEQSA